eukprot:809559-Prorocentrum_minimum.AAC.1
MRQKEATRRKVKEGEELVKHERSMRRFKAKEVPLSTLEPRYHLMEAADINRKQIRKKLVLLTPLNVI